MRPDEELDGLLSELLCPDAGLAQCCPRRSASRCQLGDRQCHEPAPAGRRRGAPKPKWLRRRPGEGGRIGERRRQPNTPEHSRRHPPPGAKPARHARPSKADRARSTTQSKEPPVPAPVSCVHFLKVTRRCGSKERSCPANCDDLRHRHAAQACEVSYASGRESNIVGGPGLQHCACACSPQGTAVAGSREAEESRSSIRTLSFFRIGQCCWLLAWRATWGTDS